MSFSSRVLSMLHTMSLQEKVGQLLVFTWKNEQQAKNDLRFHPGGYIRIYSDALTVARQSREIQKHTRIPLILAADLERGIGGTISGALEVVTAMALGASATDHGAYDAGRLIGIEAAEMGLNMNYAPVLDVNSNPANPVINTRSYGADPHAVARLGIAFAKGLQDAGVLTCGKHFPGHGDSSIDSHSQLGSVDGSRERLDKVELVPFRAAIAAGIDSIMSAHLRLPAIEPDNLPATLSKRVMTGLLRDELGFRGVAISDALDMGAVADNYSPSVALPMAINAGCDQLIMPQNNEAAFEILVEAVSSGQITEARLDEAVARVLAMKEKGGVLDERLPREESSLKVYVSDHIEQAREIASGCMTLVTNDGILPLKKDQKLFCVQFSNGDDGRSYFLEPDSFADYLAADGWKVSAINVGKRVIQPGAFSELEREMARNADVILLAAYINIRLSSGTIAIPAQALENLKPFTVMGKPVILISFGSPYVIDQFNDVSAYACAYGATQPSQEAMASAIKGLVPFKGILPVPLGI